MTQEQAAESLEIDQSTLSRLERGVLPYDRDILEKMTIVYRCHEPADLLTINPLEPNPAHVVFSQLRTVSNDKAKQAAAILKALLDAA